MIKILKDGKFVTLKVKGSENLKNGRRFPFIYFLSGVIKRKVVS